MTTKHACGFALAAAIFWFVACKKDEEVQYPEAPPQDFTADAAAPPPTDAGAPSVDAPAEAMGDGGPQALDLITQQTLAAAIDERAKKDAKWMTPVGDLFGGVVVEGSSVEQQTMFESGKCYAVVAQGGAGITELDIQVMAKPGVVPLPGPVIAVDSSTGPAASVSPCWKNPFPLSFPVTVSLIAKSGSGPVAGKVYVK